MSSITDDKIVVLPEDLDWGDGEVSESWLPEVVSLSDCDPHLLRSKHESKNT